MIVCRQNLEKRFSVALFTLQNHVFFLLLMDVALVSIHSISSLPGLQIVVQTILQSVPGESLCDTIKHKRGCFITFPNTKKRVENTTHSGVFLTNFEVFGNVMNHSLECLVIIIFSIET